MPFGRELVIRGAKERLVPIMMTVLTTGLALIPLLVSGSIPGQEIEHPMAVVILGGLITATLLNLFVVPPSTCGSPSADGTGRHPRSRPVPTPPRKCHEATPAPRGRIRTVPAGPAGPGGRPGPDRLPREPVIDPGDGGNYSVRLDRPTS